MDSFPWLLLLCFAMFAGSFLAGSVPLAFHLSKQHLQIISTFGSGMLVGTALIVILPEGVETLYALQSASTATAGSSATGSTAAAGTEFEAHKYIGAALAVGFVAMFVLDNLGGGHAQAHSGKGGGGGGGGHIVAVNDYRGEDVEEKRKGVSTATVGLMVHAAADGVALGAASASDRGSLELIVFFAIMLHKAPSAFGLSTFLLADGSFSRRSIQKHLVAFALAAPLAAIATYTVLSGDAFASDTPGGGGGDAATAKWTGVLLLFSAGTFLYVATMHILPEVYNTTGKQSRGGGGGSGGGAAGGGGGAALAAGHEHHHHRKLSAVQIVCLIAGVFMPLLLAVEHSH
ncbi:hypothetical protein HDU87_007045 [Geranomyces variabilis]|uniref:Uncharacterized protein n=1 Tax=Geranomyces variabilis TaxID=109894 RepID=A0AAD5XNI7_9FUNG|nr:hypothetical protein HDU87_007045 [Geranomyces variabilis]